MRTAIKPGDKVRVRSGVYVPRGLGSRHGFVKESLGGGRAFGVVFPGHPHTVDYTRREIVRLPKTQ